MVFPTEVRGLIGPSEFIFSFPRLVCSNIRAGYGVRVGRQPGVKDIVPSANWGPGRTKSVCVGKGLDRPGVNRWVRLYARIGC